MRRLALLPLLVALCVPGGAHAVPGESAESREPASCERTGAETRLTARVRETRDGGTVVVTCDVGTRRERVVRRARGARVVMAAAATGRRVAWTEVSEGPRGGATGHLIEADGITGRRSRTRVIFRVRRFAGEAGVAYTRAGDLAWQVPEGGGHVMLQRRGGRPEEVGNGITSGLRVVDDGTTLRYVQRDAAHAWIQVRPRRRPCSLRDGFEAIHVTPGVVVSRGTFREAIEDLDHVVTTTAYRACDRALGRDPLVRTEVASPHGGHALEVAAHASPFLALRVDGIDREQVTSWVESVDLRTGEARRFHVWAWTPARWVALLPDGSIAWIEHRWSSYEEPFDRVAFSRWSTSYTEYGWADSYLQLDRGEPGTLADLRADGATLRWTHRGEPRSYP